MERNELPQGQSAEFGTVENFLERFFGHIEILTYLEYIGIIAVVLIVIEMAWDWYSGKRSSFWEPLANLSFVAVSSIIELTIYGLVVIFAFSWAEQHALQTIPVTPLTWVLCLIATDFTYYWMHRIEHRVRFFWALHSVHHSSEEYDLSTSMRIFWLINLSIVFFFMPLIILGFSGPQVLVCMVIVFTYMIWVHTEKIGKLGWLDLVVSTPSVHRVHHGSNAKYLDKNYAGILLIWDRMFGTYEPEVEKVNYGLTTPINSSNPLYIGFYEIIMLWRDLRARKGFKNKLLTLIKPPGWAPSPE